MIVGNVPGAVLLHQLHVLGFEVTVVGSETISADISPEVSAWSRGRHAWPVGPTNGGSRPMESALAAQFGRRGMLISASRTSFRYLGRGAGCGVDSALRLPGADVVKFLTALFTPSPLPLDSIESTL